MRIYLFTISLILAFGSLFAQENRNSISMGFDGSNAVKTEPGIHRYSFQQDFDRGGLLVQYGRRFGNYEAGGSVTFYRPYINSDERLYIDERRYDYQLFVNRISTFNKLELHYGLSASVTQINSHNTAYDTLHFPGAGPTRYPSDFHNRMFAYFVNANVGVRYNIHKSFFLQYQIRNSLHLYHQNNFRGRMWATPEEEIKNNRSVNKRIYSFQPFSMISIGYRFG